MVLLTSFWIVCELFTCQQIWNNADNLEGSKVPYSVITVHRDVRETEG